ncbi:MAG: aquaporin Z [Bacteroidetes bacterium]|nr:aquaporin Z [Bacteroidota bacterium]
MKIVFYTEFLGTFCLVLGGCGSAVFSAAFPELGIGLLGVSIAFGLSIIAVAYSLGNISGAHLNPAVSLGLWAGGRFPAKELAPYIISQLLGALFGAAIIYIVGMGKPGFVVGDFAANGYDTHSPGQYDIISAFAIESVLTFIFLIVILGATDEQAPKGFAGLVIGLTLMLIHLISIPVTNTSVNPARSTCQAVFVGGWALSQLWLFWLAPIAGALLAGISYKYFKK